MTPPRNYKTYPVVVGGGRNYSDYSTVAETLDKIYERYGSNLLLIHGGATGADTLANRWAIAKKVRVIVEEAEWDKYGLSAGPIRNQRMLDIYQPRLVIAFPGNRGTDDLVRQAIKSAIPVFRVDNIPKTCKC